MFQPRVKLEFIRRYLPATDGWVVFVDIDPSEEGRTGGDRKSPAAIERQAAMKEDARRVREEFRALAHVHLGPRSQAWEARLGAAVPRIDGDRDIIAVHPPSRRILVVEVEGVSSGQPETKAYKAVGQAVAALGAKLPSEYTFAVGVVVHGSPVAEHLRRCSAIETLGAFGLHLATAPDDDEPIFSGDVWPIREWEARRQEPATSTST